MTVRQSMDRVGPDKTPTNTQINIIYEYKQTVRACLPAWPVNTSVTNIWCTVSQSVCMGTDTDQLSRMNARPKGCD